MRKKICKCNRIPGEVIEIDPKGNYYCRRCGLMITNLDKNVKSKHTPGLTGTPLDKFCPKTSKIYLASPYTHTDYDMMETRYELALMAAAAIANAGFKVFSPIVYTHVLAHRYNIRPTDSDWWVDFDECFVDWSTGIAILMLPGWEKSTGVEKEKRRASEQEKLIVFLSLEDIHDISRAGSTGLD